MNKGVAIFSLDKRYRPLERRVARAARRALRRLGENKAGLDIYLIGNGAMRTLNRKFRKRNRTTGVLSFAEPKRFPHPESKNRYLGEIYLAPDHIRASGGDLELLFVHGLLHLLGYTHRRESDRIKMEKLEAWLTSRRV